MSNQLALHTSTLDTTRLAEVLRLDRSHFAVALQEHSSRIQMHSECDDRRRQRRGARTEPPPPVACGRQWDAHLVRHRGHAQADHDAEYQRTTDRLNMVKPLLQQKVGQQRVANAGSSSSDRA